MFQRWDSTGVPYGSMVVDLVSFQCRLYWQNQGDFLCVRVDRHTKTKKSIFCNLEIFSVREKNFPVEVVELKGVIACPL